MCVYGFNVNRDVSVEDAMIEVSKYFVTGVFLKPTEMSAWKKLNDQPEGVFASIALTP